VEIMRLLPAGSTATAAVVLFLALGGCVAVSSCGAGPESDPGSVVSSIIDPTAAPTADGPLYPVVSVADGDTVTVSIDGVRERVRLIGIDAPELGSPGECYGRESADRAAALLTGTSVQLIADDTQSDRDRYGRLLRYVVLADGTLVNAVLVKEGDAREYTYDEPYRHQQQFRALEEEARSAGSGIWSAACRQSASAATDSSSATSRETRTATTQVVPDPTCPIKGNVNSKGDRIFHVPGDDSYADTVITPAKGERWFCSVQEAQAAGWRAAKN
jgi:micrococcal nuclease